MLLVDAGFLVRKSHQHIISGCRMVLQKQGKNLQNGIVLTAFFDTIQFYLAANIRFSILQHEKALLVLAAAGTLFNRLFKR